MLENVVITMTEYFTEGGRKMKNFKVNLDWFWFSNLIILFPTVSLQHFWHGFAIGIVWLNFQFSIDFRRASESKYQGMDYTGKNAVVIDKIEESEEEEN